MKLSRRLSCLKAQAQDASSIWDIGCDHGQLGLSFIDWPSVKSIHLVDPSEAVINKLKQRITDAYITIPQHIKIHHQKGQEITLGTEKKTVFIAGMGGAEILKITSHLESQLSPEDQLILSPHRKLLEVRRWLSRSQLTLISELLIEEDGQFYVILNLSKDPKRRKVSLFGEDIWKGELGEKYLKHQLQTFLGHKDQASREYVTYLKGLILLN